ncbi:MAG: agmatine deiminase family protein [Planctomycetota bacterium]
MASSRRLTTFCLRFAPVFAALTAGYCLRGIWGPHDSSGLADIRSVAESPETAAGSPPATGFGPTLKNAGAARMPAEFEPIDALMLGVNELIEYHPETLAAIVAALDGDTGIIALISQPDQEQRTLDLLRGRGIATDGIRFFMWPAESMWVQDFGPQQVLGDEVRIVDFEYDVSGRGIENQLPMAFAATFGMKISHCNLSMEGGNMLSNGRGFCISTTTIINQNTPLGHDVEGIGRILHADFGFDRWSHVLPLAGESTGHLDMFLTIAGPATVLLASYDAAEDHDNAVRMDETARMLAGEVTVDGRPLEVIRIRQPAIRDGCCLSYTNVIYGNGVVIVPQFPGTCPDLDREALEVYRRVFPDRRIVGIDASKIVKKQGGLHCLSLSIPRLPGATGRTAASR